MPQVGENKVPPWDQGKEAKGKESPSVIVITYLQEVAKDFSKF